MAQSVSFQAINRGNFLVGSNTSVSVSQSSNDQILEIYVQDIERICVQISVTGQNLDAFLIQAKVAGGGSYQTLYSAAGDFTSPTGLLVGASGDLTTLAAAATGWFIMDVRGLSYVKLLASSGNAAGSTVSVYVGGQ